MPAISNIVKAVARTIGGTTYANVGNVYTQNHCGVQVTAEAAGALGSTVEEMTVALVGYSGADYGGTAQDDEIDFTSGLLTMAGETTIRITAEDTRGRITVVTETITVAAYTAPEGTLGVERVDAQGDPDDMGTYAEYTITKRYTQVGSNSLTAVTLTSQGVTAAAANDTGDLLPGSRQTFSAQNEYIITLTLTDAFETTTITQKLPSAKFIFYVDSGGDRIGFMKAATKAVPAGKTSVVEFSADSQIYIGDVTLEQYIQNVIANS